MSINTSTRAVILVLTGFVEVRAAWPFCRAHMAGPDTHTRPEPALASQDRAKCPGRQKASPSMGFIWRALLTPQRSTGTVMECWVGRRRGQPGAEVCQAHPKATPKAQKHFHTPSWPHTAVPWLQASLHTPSTLVPTRFPPWSTSSYGCCIQPRKNAYFWLLSTSLVEADAQKRGVIDCTDYQCQPVNETAGSNHQGTTCVFRDSKITLLPPSLLLEMPFPSFCCFFSGFSPNLGNKLLSERLVNHILWTFNPQRSCPNHFCVGLSQLYLFFQHLWLGFNGTFTPVTSVSNVAKES